MSDQIPIIRPGPWGSDVVGRPATPVVRRVAVDASPADEDGATALPLFAALWRRKWTVLACVVVAVLSGIVYLKVAVPVYRSTAVVYVDESLPLTINNQRRSQTEGLEALQQVVRSVAVVGRAVEQPELAQRPLVAESSNPVGAVRSILRVKADEDANVLEISGESPDPVDNAAVANAVVGAFLEHQAAKYRRNSAEQLRVLRGERARLQKELELRWAELLAFQKQHQSLGYSNGKNTASDARLASLSSTLTSLELSLGDAEVAANAAANAGDDLLELTRIARHLGLVGRESNAYAEEEYERFAAELAAAKFEHATHLAALGPDHRLTQHAELRMRIADTGLVTARSEVHENRAKQLRELIQNHVALVRAKLADLRARYDEEYAATLNKSGLAVEYAQIQSATDRASRQLEQVEAQIREVGLSEDYTAMNVAMLEPATPSLNIVKPRAAIVLGLSVILGLVTGCGAGFLRELLDDRLRDPDRQTTAYFGLRVLGEIPLLQSDRSLLPVAHRDLGVVNRPHSAFAEAFRGLRTAIRFGVPDINTKTLLIASSMPREGKSMVAANLALAFAQSGRRTLLIDADLRAAHQHQLFRIAQPTEGLGSVLKGQVSLQDAIVASAYDQLSILPAGPVCDHPADLLNGDPLEKLLMDAESLFDQVIIDSPPVNIVNDARIISARAGGTLLVLRADESRESSVRAAIESLGAVQAPIIGAVVNGRELREIRYPARPLQSVSLNEGRQLNGGVKANGNGHGNGKHSDGLLAAGSHD